MSTHTASSTEDDCGACVHVHIKGHQSRTKPELNQEDPLWSEHKQQKVTAPFLIIFFMCVCFPDIQALTCLLLRQLEYLSYAAFFLIQNCCCEMEIKYY